jgi:hypothetical protein
MNFFPNVYFFGEPLWDCKELCHGKGEQLKPVPIARRESSLKMWKGESDGACGKRRWYLESPLIIFWHFIYHNMGSFGEWPHYIFISLFFFKMLCTALTCRKVRQIFLFTSNFGVPEWSQTSQVQSRGKQQGWAELGDGVLMTGLDTHRTWSKALLLPPCVPWLVHWSTTSVLALYLSLGPESRVIGRMGIGQWQSVWSFLCIFWAREHRGRMEEWNEEMMPTCPLIPAHMHFAWGVFLPSQWHQS